ncbi:SusC/RagA family TonB-linked outer membrane protein [Pontibacter sp. KCTC 32443]|uniref:SusC/RagA family TonB-linked outer membrane protein n=1 Tax=Pontibacter TaxID=323449 RepID=UPI00164E63F6|nr:MULTISPECIES: SusC/RagA family TonB-linked outer membrane protein [Pontibacter]MBC5773433.1 SusC/RagA family TonB-linked outer membrane protein [Pontibacter sp. KCTC 32443]
MKQTLHPTKSSRAVSLTLGLLFFSFAATAQPQPSDTLQLGYGNRTLNTVTENAGHLKEPAFNKGLLTSPEQLVNGRFAGLRITPGSGQPGAGSHIKLRSATSVFGATAPLIVIDGVPFDNTYPSIYTGYLNFINPNDITSVTLLKDAATIAMYGEKAVNGVMYITTKTPAKNARLSVSYSSTGAVSVLRKKAEVLSTSEFRELVQSEFPEKEYLLGDQDTDWQDVIYRKAFSHDQHLSLSGSLLKTVPFNVSIGHLNQNGILKASKNTKNTLALSLNPSLLDDHLRLNLQVRGTQQILRVADTRAIVNAMAFDPTQPVYQNNEFGGYFTYTDENGELETSALLNPLFILEQRNDEDRIGTLQAQGHLQYRLHFFPSLTINARYAKTKSDNAFKTHLPVVEYDRFMGEKFVSWDENSRNLDNTFKEAFISYNQPLLFMQSKLNIVTGVNRKELESNEEIANTSLYKDMYTGEDKYSTTGSSASYRTEHNSVFGRLSLTFRDNLTVETAFAQDQASRLSKDNEKYTSAAVGAGWSVVNNESGMLSSLRFNTNYSSFSNAEFNTYGSNVKVDSKLKPEETQKLNVGVAFGAFKNKLFGDINVYTSTTKDMFILASVSPQTGYGGVFVNGGESQSKGIEASLNYKAISNDKVEWILGTNLSYGSNEITKLSLVKTVLYNNFLGLEKGYPVNSFYLLQQLYSAPGKPIENSFEKDENGNNTYKILHSADPTFSFGLTSRASYKKFSLDLLLRGSVGGHAFNFNEALQSSLIMVDGQNFMENIGRSYLDTGFENRYPRSSYYLKNTSFIRMEFLQVGYDVGTIWKEHANLTITATVQNAFVITKYNGQDPEVAGNIDYGQYPQPTTFSLGLKLDI